MIAWLGNFLLIVYYWRIAKKHRDALLFAAGGNSWLLTYSKRLLFVKNKNCSRRHTNRFG